MPTEADKEAEKAEAARQMAAWIVARCGVDEIPQVVAWMEQAKPKAVVGHLMSVLTKHRRRTLS